MAKRSQKMIANIKKAAAAAKAKREAEQQRRARRAMYDESERLRKHRSRLQERRADLKRKHGQIVTEAEVRLPLLPYALRSTSLDSPRDDERI